MVQLTSSQYEALNNLVEGNGRPIDGRTMIALRNRGLVNDYGYATTSGWHTVGHFRYFPKMPRLQQFEIDSWEGSVLVVQEEPSMDHSGERTWTRADKCTYYFDFHKLVKWYADVLDRQIEYVKRIWDNDRDRDVELYGFHAHERLMIDRDAKEDALRNDDYFYTNHIFYDVVSNYIGHQVNTQEWSRASFKYSLQDNEDEFQTWLVNPQPARLTWFIDVD